MKQPLTKINPLDFNLSKVIMHSLHASRVEDDFLNQLIKFFNNAYPANPPNLLHNSFINKSHSNILGYGTRCQPYLPSTVKLFHSLFFRNTRYLEVFNISYNQFLGLVPSKMGISIFGARLPIRRLLEVTQLLVPNSLVLGFGTNPLSICKAQAN